MDEVLGFYLGLTKNKGNKMTQLVLKINGELVPWRFLRRLRLDELSSDVEILKQSGFDAKITISHGD